MKAIAPSKKKKNQMIKNIDSYVLIKSLIVWIFFQKVKNNMLPNIAYSSSYMIVGSVLLLWIRNDFFRSRIQLWIFRVPDPDPTQITVPVPVPYLSIFGNKKNTLNSIKKKNLPVPTICHLLSNTTVYKVHNSQA